MIIEVTGAGFGNKGAELMLAAIVDHLDRNHPECIVAVRPHAGAFRKRSRYGLLQILDARRAGRMGWLIERLLHRGYRQRYGLIAESEVDLVLDASGYALGDPWRPEWIEGKASHYERLRRDGSRIVLLPQAIGPLDNPRVRKGTARVLAAADLVFARDPQSFDAAGSVMDDNSRLILAPDFTNLLPGRVPDDFEDRPDRVALIPNNQMRMHASDDEAENYVNLFARLSERIGSAGLFPCLLLHEDSVDRPLAEEIGNEAKVSLPIIEYSDPIEIKGAIGTCAFTIGSRFHGLVSALSQGVPSIGTSWSHKYEYLFKDYGVPELLLDSKLSMEQKVNSLDLVLNPESLANFRMRIQSNVARQLEQARAMWAQVGDFLGSESGRP